MFLEHPSKEDFESFLRGNPRLGRNPRNPQVMRHLLNNCAPCRDRLVLMGWSKDRLGRLLQPTAEEASMEAGANAYDYSSAFAVAERSVSALLTTEPPADVPAPVLLAELEALAASEQAERMRGGAPFVTPALVRLLVDRSHSVRYTDTGEMLHLANLARLAADGCSPEQMGDEMRLADLQTRAWGQYGNALRLCGRPREAEMALATGWDHREQGTGDPVLRAWMLERAASLLVFQGHYEVAIEQFEEAGQVYQGLDENHQFAGTMVQKAIASIYSGEAEQAVHTLNQAIPLIDHEEDPHLLLAACHNLIWCYVDLDQPDKALTLYNEVRELYQEFDDPLILLRATWQEGRLLRDLGHLRAAETALLQARKGFLEEELIHEVALISLDLATVYVKLGLVEEVKRTALMAIPIFHALRVKVETLAALLQLQQVADQEQQALELIRTLNARVESLAKNKSAH
ncbi:MAG TPA: tetratricopeptide repeat protein [Thermoanaerobaculia bacterium]|jgi:tetratricopeptide (TPR) repeat protein|nr:tetratricopeptide repeat protein [Thermoanaerobaculia bacterium]